MPDVPAWVRDAVFYQVFPDRFAGSERVRKPGPLEPWDSPPTNYGFKGGDLLGIVEHLDHIESLGVNALYLTPVFQSASNHRYHTYDYLAVDPLLGGNEALRELLDVAHARNIRVILDGVFNHTGRGFWPFHHVLETGIGSPYQRWFHFDADGLLSGRPVNAYPAGRLRSGMAGDVPVPGEEDPSDATSARARLGYEAWWGMPALPKLNTDEPAVREYLWNVAEHWLRFGIDGWRLDVPAEINDPPFWAEFRRRCRAVNPEAYLVGEIWHVAPEWLAGDRFDALMNYPLAEAIIGYVGGRSLNEPLLRSHHEYGQTARLDGAGFAKRLGELLAAYAPETVAVQLNLLDSHDTPRVFSLLGGDREAMELAVLLQATLPGAPCTYYGGEIGLLGGIDPDSRRAFPWDEGRWDRELLEAVRACFALRHAEPALRADGVSFGSTSGGALTFERQAGDRRLVVALNAGDEAVSLPMAGGGAFAPGAPAPGGPPCRGPGSHGAGSPGSDGRRDRDRASASVGCRRRRRLNGPERPRTYTPAMSDLPVALPAELEPLFIAAFDPQSKLAAAIDALGPVADRDVLVVDAVDGPVLRALGATGARIATQPARTPFTLDGPDGSADVVLGLWSAFRGVDPVEQSEVDRVLRPGGRLLVVHDYGRDDVSRLFPPDRPEYGAWSHRFGPFLKSDFRVRVVHCFWEFESLEIASAFLAGAFDAGAEVAATLKRPRLSYNVAVYHRSRP